MLEFQEGFFDQEVRDGFYLDTTMKSLWAAELEVLQKVAEVCDRHGVKWYAAYGTLLGAIRHEGFVPWDDDMDIWVKRPDYNILMQVLPKELPEGYLVRSPLTDEGYDQYHTCVFNGNNISIARERLEQYHGCPFTVGLDIFPLDYLPRDEEERVLQANLLAMMKEIVQLVQNVNSGDHDLQDSETEQTDSKKWKIQKELAIEEINRGIDYLEKNCNLKIDRRLLEDEEWYKMSSELWKWANYLAMMYSEDESDHMMEAFDYIQCPHKVYPKEWFADGYSAAYENFMLPVPAGYDELMRYIYGLGGNYLVRVKKTGTHDYPYYAGQLKYLREYVKSKQNQAIDIGLVRIEDIEIEEETDELLPEWIPIIGMQDDPRKKIVLSANDAAVYATYGDAALDKLEEMLGVFEKEKDSVLLWWRPQPVMKKILAGVSPELAKRYQRILDDYKNAGWGICDETDNTERAVKHCDVYYGDMNAVLQPFQDAGKPILLSVMDGEGAQKENAERINEYRTFFSMTDFVEDEERIYFANVNYNALIVADKKTGIIEKHIPFEGFAAKTQNMHLKCVQWQDKIVFMPTLNTPCLHIYHMKSGTNQKCDFQNPEKKYSPWKFDESWEYFVHNGQIYLLPCRGGQGLWKLTPEEDAPVLEDWWDAADERNRLKHGTIDEKCFYTLEVKSGRLYITNVEDRTIECVELPNEIVKQITYDGENFWYTMDGISDIICWNKEQGIVDKYEVSYDEYYLFGADYGLGTYLGIYYAGGNLFLVSGDGRFLYVLDRDAGELRTLCEVECARGAFSAKEMMPSFKQMDHFLLCMLQNAGEILTIDLETLEVVRSSENFGVDENIEDEVLSYQYKILFDRKALVFEEAGVADLSLLLQYCMEDDRG